MKINPIFQRSISSLKHLMWFNLKNALVKIEATDKIEDGNSDTIPDAAEKGRL